jgi:phage portal protein BeeE
MAESNLDYAIKDAEDLTLRYRADTVSSRAEKYHGGGHYGGMGGQIESMLGGNRTQGSEQYRHFYGWSYVAIRAIAQRIAAQPLKLLETKEKSKGLGSGNSINDVLGRLNGRNLPTWTKGLGANAESKVISEHPLLDSLQNPNEIMTQWSLMYTTVASLELTGCAYWWFERKNGEVKIWPLPSHWVEPKHCEVRGLFHQYKVTPQGGGEPFVVDGADMAYFPLPDPSNPMTHLSPLQTQSKAVATDEAIQDSQFRAFQNGIFPGVIMTVGRLPDMAGGGAGERPVLTGEQRRSLVDAARMFYQGTAHYDEPMVIDGMIEKVEKFSNNPSEMDFMQSGAQVKARIFQAFGVNPMILGEVVAGSYSQSAVADNHFCHTVLNPLLTLMGQVITKFMRPFFNSTDNCVAYFEPAQSQDKDHSLRAWQAAAHLGVVTPNEYRTEVLNIQPSEDPAADDLLIVTNTEGIATEGDVNTAVSEYGNLVDIVDTFNNDEEAQMSSGLDMDYERSIASGSKDVDLSVTAGMITEAKRGLAWREEFGRGGTNIGAGRATQIINNKKLSEDVWRRTKSYFDRHQKDNEGQGWSPNQEGYPSAGRIAWALWGGDAGYSRAKAIVKRLNAERDE